MKNGGKAGEGSGSGHSAIWLILLGPALLLFIYITYAITSLPNRDTWDRKGYPHQFGLVDTDQAATFTPDSARLVSPWLPTAPKSFVRLKGINVMAPAIKNSVEATEEGCAAACVSDKACNGYGYCGDKSKCHGPGPNSWHSCVLKNIPDVTKLDTKIAGSGVGWTSGVLWSRSDVPALLKARGFDTLITSSLILGLRNGSLTIETVSPRDNPTFNFAHAVDADSFKTHKPGYHHLGDLSMRLKEDGEGGFKPYSTVRNNGSPMPPPPRRLPGNPAQLFLADLTPSLPQGCPLTVHRWLEVPNNTTTFGGPAMPTSVKGLHPASMWLPGEVHVWYRLSYEGGATRKGKGVEIGSLGFSMPLDQFFKGLKLEQVAAQGSFVEGYPGGHYGYVQVTRASGNGPVLLILPLPGTSFEAWRPLKDEDAMYHERDFAFEGTFEIMAHSKAWAENEWRTTPQWVSPSSLHLSPGQSALYGFRLLLAPDPQHVEDTLLAAGHPVAVGVPGFTLHADTREGRLMVRMPQGLQLQGMVQEPSGALEIQQLPAPSAQPPGTHLASYRIRAAVSTEAEGSWGDAARWSSCQLGSYKRLQEAEEGADGCPCYTGRVRLVLQFRSDGGGVTKEQIVQLLIVPPARTLVTTYGRISSDPKHGWLPADAGDPWGRGPAFMGYDNEAKTKLMAEPRVFMSGLSDEAGASQPLAMAMKQLGHPVPEEIEKLEAYVHETLFQAEGQTDGKYIQARGNYSVRASMFFYKEDAELEKAQPKFIQGCNQSRWWLICWEEARSKETWRAYNYPHVAAVYWSLYRLSRLVSPPMAKRATWDWYLRQAVHTSTAMWKFGPGYGKWGLMVGSVFIRILDDVVKEGWKEEEAALRAVMMERVAFWQSLTFPFGSEMAWDNTGHEEIFTWLDYLGEQAGADATVQAITAYDALFPHWGLSGSARRWWDFFINGKTGIGNERVLHHYASPLNAVPLMQHYRKHPDQLFHLRLATAGLGSSVANIKPDGGPSMGFHADPSLLKLDGYSADWGIGFYGYCTQVTAVLTCDPSGLGWLCFQCDITSASPPLETLHKARGNGCGGLDSNSNSNGGGGSGAVIRFEPRDAMRARAYIAAYGVQVEVSGAEIRAVKVDMRRHVVSVYLSSHASSGASSAYGRNGNEGLIHAGEVVEVAQGRAAGGGARTAGRDGEMGAAVAGAAEGDAAVGGSTATLQATVMSLTQVFRVRSVRNAGLAGQAGAEGRGGASGQGDGGADGLIGGELPKSRSGGYQVRLSATGTTAVEVALEGPQ